MSASQDLQEADPRSFTLWQKRIKQDDCQFALRVCNGLDKHKRNTPSKISATNLSSYRIRKLQPIQEPFQEQSYSIVPEAFKIPVHDERRGDDALAFQAAKALMMVVLRKEVLTPLNKRVQSAFHNVWGLQKKTCSSKGSRSRLSWWHCRRDKEGS